MIQASLKGGGRMFELKQKETSEDRANLVVVCAGILQSSNTQESAANKGRG